MVVRIRGYTDWSWYGKCKTCPALSGERCRDLRKRKPGIIRFADVPHKGRVKRVDL